MWEGERVGRAGECVVNGEGAVCWAVCGGGGVGGGGGGREGAAVGEGGVVWGGGVGFGDGRGLHLPSSQPLGVDVGPQGTTVKKHCGLMCNKSAFAYLASTSYIYIYIS